MTDGIHETKAAVVSSSTLQEENGRTCLTIVQALRLNPVSTISMEMAGSRIEPRNGKSEPRPQWATSGLHPSWQALIRLCRDMGHGEIERIKIQDGLPVSAEVVRKKVRWF